MYKILDNILTKEHQTEIRTMMESANFPWYWNDSMVDYNTGSKNKSPGQLTHNFLYNGEVNSQYFDKMRVIIEEFIKKTGVKLKGINRFKANLNPKTIITREELKDGYHRDFGDIEYDSEAEEFYSKFISMIYYVNDSDGDTLFFDPDGKETRVTPKEGRIVWFPSYSLHGGTPPEVSKKRIIINFIFERE
jgi:hypothetical protein